MEIKRINKPWGYELVFAHTPQYAGKVLYIKKGEELSFQYHSKKEETIYLYKGKLRLEIETDQKPLTLLELKVGENYHIKPGVRHRMHALEDCEVFEVSTPELDDVIRLKDSYGRVT